MRKHFLILMLLSLLPFAAGAHNASWNTSALSAAGITVDEGVPVFEYGTTITADYLHNFLTVTNSYNGDPCDYYPSLSNNPTGNVNRYKVTPGTNPSTVATHTAAVLVRGQNNSWQYTNQTINVTYRVAPKEVEVTFYSYNKTYGDADYTAANLIPAAYTVTTAGVAWSDIKGFITLSRLDFGEDVGTYGYQAAQNDVTGSTNFLLHFSYGGSGAKVNIEQAPLDVIISTDGDDNKKTYGDDDPASFVIKAVDPSQFKNGDDISVVTADLTRAVGENVDDYDITGTATATNYNVNLITPGKFTITQADLTLEAKADTKVYGDADPTFALAVEPAYKNGDDATSIGLTITRPGAGTDENVDEYTAAIVTDANAQAKKNYNITFTPAKFTITPADLTLEAKAANKVYGDAEPTFELNNTPVYKNGDDATSIGLTITRPGAGTDENVDVYTDAIVTDANALAKKNYNITFTPADFEITPADLTLEAKAADKIYGDADPTFVLNNTPVYKNGDDAASIGLTITRPGFGTDENVDVYTDAIVTDANAQAKKNYNITFTPADFEITPADLTVEVKAAQKVYGEADPTFELNNTPVYKNGDDADAIGLTITRPGAGTDENVKTYVDAIVADANAQAKTNYNINFVAGDFTINPYALTITAKDAEKVYGQPDPKFETETIDFQNGDDAEKIGLGFNREKLGLAEGELVGNYAITPTATSANYDYTFVPANLEIKKAALTLTAVDDTKVYGDADPAFDAEVTGLTNGDTKDALAIEVTRSNAAEQNVGTYAGVLEPAATSAVADNYEITPVNGKFEITKAALTLTADADQNKVYGDADPTFTATATGLKNGDTKESIGLTVSRTNADEENVGVYADVLVPAATSANYEYTTETAAFEITKAALTLKAKEASKTYGDDDPAFELAEEPAYKNGDNAEAIGLTITRTIAGENYGFYGNAIEPAATSANYEYTIEKANFTINKAELTLKAKEASKVYGSDDPAFELAEEPAYKNGDNAAKIGLTISREVAGEDVDTYADAIVPAAISANYSYTIEPADFTITKKDAKLTAVDKSKTYGNAEPTYTVVAEGLTNGDDLTTIGWSTSRAEGENVGTYAITPAATSENYEWEYVPGTLTIEKRGLLYALSNKEVEYNGKAVTTEGVYTLSSGSFADGESLASLGISFDFFDEIKNAGTYNVDKLNVNYNENGNYDINFTGAASVKVNQKPFAEAMITNFVTPKTYTGFAQDPEIAVADMVDEANIIAESDYEVTIAKDEAAVTADEVVEAGVYTYTFTPTADGNYKGDAVAKEFVIGGMAITADMLESWTDEVVYNGEDQTPEYVLSYVNAEEETVTLKKGTDYTVAVTRGELTVNEGEIKDSYSYTFTFNGAGNYVGQFTKIYTINKAEINVVDNFVAPAAVEGLKYSAADLTLITAGSVTVDTEDTDVKVLYSLDNENFVEDLPTGYNAGNYPVYFMIDGGLNYIPVGFETPIAAQIAKRVVIVTAESVERVYDATTGLGALEPEVIYSGLQGEDKAEDVVEFTGASIFTGAAVTAKNVGVYNIGIDYEHMFATNYEFAEAETQGTMTINAADVILTLNDRDEDGNYLINKEYGMADNANQFKNFLEVEGAVASEVNTLKGYVTISRTNASEKNVGKYDDVLKINLQTSTQAKYFFKNYNVDATYVGDFEIVKRGVTMALKADLEKVYDDAVPTLNELTAADFVVTSLVPGDDMSQFSVLPTATIVDATKNVGVYTITLDGAEAKNYEISYLDARYTITPRELTNFNVQTQVVRVEDNIDDINHALWQVEGIQGDDDKDAIFELVVADGLYDEDGKINAAADTYLEGLVLVVKDADAAANYSGYDFVTGNLTVVDETGGTAIVLFDDQEQFDNLLAADGKELDVTVVVNRNQAIGSYSGTWESDEWNTMVLPFEITPKELSEKFGYAIVNLVDPTRTTEGNVCFKLNLTQKIPANTPFTIRTEEAIPEGTGIDFGKRTIVAPASDKVAVDAGCGYSFVGVYNTFTIDKNYPNYHFLVNGGWKHIGASSSNSYDILPFNCYVDQSASSSVRPEDVTFTFEDENGVTAIKTVNVDGEAMFAEGWYTLEGKKLNAAPAQKGVYIHNGKKTVIK